MTVAAFGSVSSMFSTIFILTFGSIFCMYCSPSSLARTQASFCGVWNSMKATLSVTLGSGASAAGAAVAATVGFGAAAGAAAAAVGATVAGAVVAAVVGLAAAAGAAV